MASEQTGHANPLKVSITHIPDEGLAMDVKISAEALHLPQVVEDAEFPEALQLRGRLSTGIEQMYFRGKLYGAALLPCSRCLDMSRHTFTVEMVVMFLPPASGRRENEDEEADLRDETDIYIHDGLQLDLGPAVYDQVVLALPLQPFCRPECAGLCQVCGSNLNEVSCACHTANGDPRFALLQQLSFPKSS